jgi:circadian clock protein KaiB
MNKKRSDSSADLEKAIANPARDGRYMLRLFITGMTPRSTEAVANIKALCEEKLAGRYELQIIDIYQNPQLAREEQILAAPTLVKTLPAPLRRLIGNLSIRSRVLKGLDLLPEPEGT